MYVMLDQILFAEHLDFMASLNATRGTPRIVSRSNVYEDVIKLYEDEAIVLECPLSIEFEGEVGVDAGGVTRDMFSAFWESCYATLSDGSTLLVPMISPQMDISLLSTLGRILSHGYLVCGFIPVRIALPCLLGILCGPCAEIPQTVLQEAILDYVSSAERLIFKDALNSTEILPVTQGSLLGILSRFSCRQVPTTTNLRSCLQQVARFEFCCKPAVALSVMHSGIPRSHTQFWSSKTVVDVCTLYTSLTVSTSKVLEILDFEPYKNSAEERVGGYLIEMIGNMTNTQLQQFLRFTTGSNVLVASSLHLEFNRLSDLGRRPIAHTCDSMLELPVLYSNFHDFYQEWIAILSDPEYSWRMDCI